MGVMEKMRKGTGVILWVLIFAFGILWMLQNTKVFNVLGRGPRSLGSVNGERISMKQYQQEINNYSDRYSQQTGKSANAEQRANFRQMAWNNLVTSKLLSQKMDQLGIKVTDQEVVNMIKGKHPAPFIRKEFGKKDGTINRVALNKAIQSKKNNKLWIAIEQHLRQQRRRQKMSNYIQAAMQVSKPEINQQYVENNTTADISYVRFPYAEVKKSNIKVTNADLKKYYKNHRQKFHQDKSFRFKYVTFDKTPTKKDTMRTINELKKLRPKFAKASKDSVFLAQYQSTTNYNPNFVPKKNIRDLFRSALAKLKKGEVSPVLKDNGNVYIVKKEDEKGDKVKFSVLSHQIKADPVATIDKKANQADDFRYFAKKKGFSQEAKRRNLKIHNGFATKGNTFIAGLGQSRQILNVLKSSSKGAISKSIELPGEFVVLKVTKITPAGTRPFNKVKSQIKTTVLAQKRQQMLHKRIAGLLKNHNSLQSLASASGKKVQTAKSIAMSDNQIPGAGREPKVIGAIFGLKKGELSKPIEGTSAIFVVKVTHRNNVDPKSMSTKTAKNIRKQLQKQKNSLFAQVWLKQLKAHAHIVDNRSKLSRR
ncbi:MAG TPA: SurA N-terminal domain-containing protein [Balneolaceae bacterium]|nr:SurA N-terminal domain-containing protein [Balneolaceae bacterium]